MQKIMHLMYMSVMENNTINEPSYAKTNILTYKLDQVLKQPSTLESSDFYGFQ